MNLESEIRWFCRDCICESTCDPAVNACAQLSSFVNQIVSTAEILRDRAVAQAIRNANALDIDWWREQQ